MLFLNATGGETEGARATVCWIEAALTADITVVCIMAQTTWRC